MPAKLARILVVSIGAIGALFLHLYLGWQWTLLAGVAVGAVYSMGGWWYGGLAVLVDWAALVGWSLYEAPAATEQMARSMGAILGSMPGFVFVGITLCVGFGLGAVGGLLGSQLGRLNIER